MAGRAGKNGWDWARTLIALIAIVLTALTQWWPPAQSALANEWLRDHIVRAQATAEPEARVLVVDIDEASLASVGPWPWPRKRLAALLESLLDTYQAKGVALDLVLPEAADAAGDARVAVLSQHGPVVLAQAFDYVKRALPLRVGTVAGGSPVQGQTAAPRASGYIGNHAGLASAPRVGNIGFLPDPDGAIRRLPLQTTFGERLYPTLSLALLDCCGGAAGQSADSGYGQGYRRIPFAREFAAYTVVPASAVLDASLPAAALSGRLVLVGSSSLGLADRVATPLDASSSGLMVHAEMLSALLDDQAQLAPRPWPGGLIAFGFSLLVAALVAYAFPRLAAAWNVALLGGASVAWLALAYAIAPHDAHFSTTGPLAANLFLLLVAVPFGWQSSQRESRRLLLTLRQYVAEAVVDELLKSELKDPLAPRRLHVTTLVADMEGYTTQVEALDMEQAAQLTRDFLACLSKPVLAQHGTLDKFTGDGLVAFWGAPLPVADHADQALDAALAIVREVRHFGELRQAQGKSALRVRIGIESGIAMAGDFGNASRSIYTAVGDSVNTAARLEGEARGRPEDIIVGQGAAALIKRHQLKLLGEVMLRGKEKPTTLYAPESAP